MKSRLMNELACFAGIVAACSLSWPTHAAESAAAGLNQLSPAEQAAGWKLLFDGKTTNGWRGFNRPAFPDKGWVVEAGCLQHLAKGGGGDLITLDKYDEFDLEFEWRIAPGANSGVKYFITEERNSPIGHEYQLVDDLRNPDGRRGPKWQTASFYDCLPAATNKTLRPAGEFNQSRILVQGQHVEHWLNGTKTLEYELGSEALKAAIANSKFRNVAGFGTKFKGHLLLQDHGDEVWFRNLRIRTATGKER
jgi:hypothetical protein